MMDYLKLLELAGNTALIKEYEESVAELELLEREYRGRYGVNIDTDEVPVEQIQKQLEAASRALGIANRIPDPVYKKKHLSRVLSNMNTIRAALMRAVGDEEARGEME